MWTDNWPQPCKATQGVTVAKMEVQIVGSARDLFM